MAYAKLAELRPEFGLYSSFMGVLVYWFFATSKDITIGVSTTSITSDFISNSANAIGTKIACCRYVNVDR